MKTVENDVVVEAKHEERPDEHGYISRSFVRRYPLPNGYNAKDVTTTLSSDGILVIKAPKLVMTEKGSNVREIPIQHTGPAHMYVKRQVEGDVETSDEAKELSKDKPIQTAKADKKEDIQKQPEETENKENKDVNQPEETKSEEEDEEK